ncbi:MAG TPA: GIY-YIG nuclease family protein [Flavobacteriales bacterium]|nr:GIY-YIG nuclease family protein [Flavobacteriales bacterium]
MTRSREKAMPFWVYFITNKGNTVLYTGFTNDMVRRLFEHRVGHYPDGFAWRYQCWKLVFMEEHPTAKAAKARERQLKNWQRSWKSELIEKENPLWLDLSADRDYSGWYDANDPPAGFFVQHLKERWGGPSRDAGSSPA